MFEIVLETLRTGKQLASDHSDLWIVSHSVHSHSEHESRQQLSEYPVWSANTIQYFLNYFPMVCLSPSSPRLYSWLCTCCSSIICPDHTIVLALNSSSLSPMSLSQLGVGESLGAGVRLVRSSPLRCPTLSACTGLLCVGGTGTGWAALQIIALFHLGLNAGFWDVLPTTRRLMMSDSNRKFNGNKLFSFTLDKQS